MSLPLQNKSIGVLGLGIIGSRVAHNLARKFARVWVWNRTPKPLPCFLGSPSEVAEHAETLLIFVKDGKALRTILENMQEALTPRHLVICHSTVSPHEVKEAADFVIQCGASFLDAPFTGSKEAAENNQMVYYIGGDLALIERARPILAVSAKAILTVGRIGDASLVKVATNMITATAVAALAEALALIKADGLSGEILGEALAHNASNSLTLQAKIALMNQADFSPRFSLSNMKKDMNIAKQLLAEHQIDGEQVLGFLRQAEKLEDSSNEQLDFSILYRSLVKK